MWGLRAAGWGPQASQAIACVPLGRAQAASAPETVGMRGKPQLFMSLALGMEAPSRRAKLPPGTGSEETPGGLLVPAAF